MRPPFVVPAHRGARGIVLVEQALQKRALGPVDRYQVADAVRTTVPSPSSSSASGATGTPDPASVSA